MKKIKNTSFYLIILILIIAGAYFFNSFTPTATISYNEAMNQISAGNVKTIKFDGNSAVFTLAKEVNGKIEWTISVPNSEVFVLDANNRIKALDPKITTNFYKVDKPDYSMLYNIIITVVIVGLMLYFIFGVIGKDGGVNGKAMSFGKSKHRLNVPGDRKVTFDDVAGADEEKEELKEIVEFLKQPAKFLEMGARIPKGVLLVGPPGTGKTLLAKSVAGEAGVPFYTISGSDFVEMFVGVGASRVRDLFESAKKTLPCIIFIDEVDAVGRQRGTGLGGGNDEREQTLNQLLVEMDGFGFNEGIIVIAATNRADVLDPALLRPGRFDRRIFVAVPDVKGREEILKVHAKNKKFADDIDLRDIANLTPGFTGADLENLLNEAALLAARKNKKAISMYEIKEATFKVQMGPEKKSRVMTDRDKKLTAYHEAGHAIAVRALSTVDKVDRVSIIPIGQAGGYTAYKPSNDDTFRTKQQLLERIMVALGGRAAEEIVFDEISTGAYGDLKSVNSIARDMVTQYGMSEKLGCLVVGNDDDLVFIGKDLAHTKSFSDQLASEIDDEVKGIIESCYKIVKDMLVEKRDVLDRLAQKLIEKEKIDGAEFECVYLNTEYVPEPVKEEIEIETEAKIEVKAETIANDVSETVEAVDENKNPVQIGPDFSTNVEQDDSSKT